MHHFHTKKKKENLTDTFELLTKGGKRMDVVVSAIQSENRQIF